MEKKLKTLVLITAYPEGGIGTHLISILQNLYNQYNIIVIADFLHMDQKFQMIKNQLDGKVKFETLEINKKPSIKDFVNIIKIYNIIKNDSIDIVHGHGAKGGVYARLIGKIVGAKVIYTPHGGSLHAMYGVLTGKVYITVEKLLYFMTDMIIFESEYSKKRYLKKIHPETAKLQVNYNGVKIINCQHKKIEQNSEIIEIAAFGMLRYIKGHDILVKAIAKVYAKYKNIHVTIYGEGEEKENLENLIKELNLQEVVELFGFVTKPGTYMCKSDIIVHPSRYEALPYVPIEAMSMGKVVIASNVGGMPEIIQNYDNGLLFQKDNIKDLEQCLLKLLSNPQLINKLAYRGQLTIKKHFALESQLSKLKQLYKDII